MLIDFINKKLLFLGLFRLHYHASFLQLSREKIPIYFAVIFIVHVLPKPRHVELNSLPFQPC